MWQTGCWSQQLFPLPVKCVAVSPSEAVTSVRWEQGAVTDTSVGSNEFEEKHFSQTVEVCCRTLKILWFSLFLWERNILISNKQIFLHLRPAWTLLWQETRPFLPSESSCAACSCSSRQQRWDSRLLWGVLSSHPQRLNTQFSADMIFPTSTPVLGTNPGKLKTLPHDTHSALQYLFPNSSDKCACYSVLIFSQTHQHALKWNSKGELKVSIHLQAIFPYKAEKCVPVQTQQSITAPVCGPQQQRPHQDIHWVLHSAVRHEIFHAVTHQGQVVSSAFHSAGYKCFDKFIWLAISK